MVELQNSQYVMSVSAVFLENEGVADSWMASGHRGSGHTRQTVIRHRAGKSRDGDRKEWIGDLVLLERRP